MDIQSTLTQAIEVIVMSFVALMIFDFVDGLYVVPLPPIAIAQSSANRKSIVTPPQFEALPNSEKLVVEPQKIPFVTQFEEISDPWTLELEPYNNSIETQPVVLSLPTLKLLLPVTEIQTQPKSKSRSRKTNSPELIKPKAKKTDVMTTVKRKPGRSRKAA
ncbi:hypothetical protein [Nostoc sp.]|uniref:hypothetical protein n=1 Tax=Nostoc sp. TaxID=1180 RepID=UPI002FF49DBF